MHQISSRIVSILTHSSDRSVGATLLTGPWGCGKTYLWSHEIRENLRSAHRTNPIYVSLFGVDSIDDLRSRIITAWIKDSVAAKIGESPFLDQLKKTGLLVAPAFGGLRKYLSKSVGFDPIPVKIDWLSFLPSKAIICFDDLERSAISTDLTLGIVNYLIEHKGARVLLIAHEEHLKGKDGQNLYDKFKEKVIWTSVRFAPEVGTTFDIFVGELTDSDARKRLVSLKPLILQTFKEGAWENLRTLQRVLRYLEELLSFEDIPIPDDSIRYLVAVLIEDARSGLGNERNFDVRRFLAGALRDKIKKKDSPPEEKAALEFYQRYFEDKHNVGYSSALFRFVKDGLLPKDDLIAEFKPSERPTTEDQQLLKEIQSGDWLFKTDGQIKDFLGRIRAFLLSKKDASAYCAVALYFHHDRLSSQIGETTPDGIMDAVERRIRERAKGDDKSLDRPFFQYDSQEAKDLLERFVEEFYSIRDSDSIESAKLRIADGLQNGDLDFFVAGISTDQFIIRAALAPEILATANSVFFSQPIAFYRYYRALIRTLLNGGFPADSIDAKRALEEIRSRLDAAATPPTLDNTARIRVRNLQDMLPTKPNPSATAGT